MMGDAIETKKKLAIAEHLNKLISTSARSVSDLNKDKGTLIDFVMFAFDDYLNGKTFIGNPSMEKMIGAYAEIMANMNSIMTELNQIATIRDENPVVFRANLDAMIASYGKDLDTIRKQFD